MSVGFFMGIVPSYTDEAKDAGAAFVAAINVELTRRGLPSYVDPPAPPNVYVGPLFGRSALDHHGARCLVAIAEAATEHRESPNLALLKSNPYRVAFLPADFEVPIETQYRERISGNHVPIWVGSAPRLLRELRDVAPQLGITLVAGALADETAATINEFGPLYPGDPRDLAEDERTAWLVAFEGARLAVEHGVALSLAG